MARHQITALALLLVGALSRPVSAQPATISIEPAHVAVALAGTVVATAGFGLMLHQRPSGRSDPGWIIGGAVVVQAGVLMTYIGLRPSRVTVAPVVSRRAVGVAGTVRWR